jgi:hypothetical protein
MKKASATKNNQPLESMANVSNTEDQGTILRDQGTILRDQGTILRDQGAILRDQDKLHVRDETVYVAQE